MDQLLGSKYTIGEQIGRGGMGQVFRGTVRETGDPVAVKLLKPELLSDPDIVARFFRERSILLSTSHPNVTRVLDLVAEGQTLAIVMELIEGLDLRRELTAKGTLPPAEAVRYGRELLDGLAAVHGAGIVHRDIKPENLLVDGSGDEPRLKLTDFGIARLTYGGSLTRLSAVIGTPEYMAPEIADHDSATPAADLYSTGIVLYEMLAGRTPFAGGHALAVLHRHLTAEPPPVPGAPPGLWALIDSLLAKDPAQRPRSAADVEAALAGIAPSLDGLPALAPMAAPEFAPAQRRVTPRQETEVARLPTQAAGPAIAAGGAVAANEAETMLRPGQGYRQRPPAAVPVAAAAAAGPVLPPMPRPPGLAPPGPGQGKPRRRGLVASIAAAAALVIAAAVIATEIIGHRPAEALHLSTAPSSPASSPVATVTQPPVTITATPSPVSPSTVIITQQVTTTPQPPPSSNPDGGLTPVYGYKVFHSCRAGGTCGLSVHQLPHQSAPVIGALSEGEPVAILCQTTGDLETNSRDVSSYVWDELDGGGYVSDVYISTNGARISATQSGFDSSIPQCP